MHYLSLPSSIQRTKKVVGKPGDSRSSNVDEVSSSHRLGLDAQVHADYPVGGAL